MENVKGLISHDNKNTFNTILTKINEISTNNNEYYKTKYIILNTKDFGIPQNRERVYIICFKNNIDYEKFKFIDINKYKNKYNIIEKKISDILENNVDDKYYYDSRFKCYDLLKSNITNYNTIYQYRRTYVRENKNGICPTITYNMCSGGHNVPLILQENNKIRKLTPKECFKLQGFNKKYKLNNLNDNKLYGLAGNAISVCVVKYLSKCLKKIIKNNK